MNVIAPIATEPGGRAWRQTTFHPFAQASRHATGEVLRVEPVCPTYETKAYGEVPVLDAVAARDEETGETTLFMVNRSVDQSLTVDVDVRTLGAVKPGEATTLADPDPYAWNTADDPFRVVPRANPEIRVEGGTLTAVLPPVSWNVIRLLG